ncbi:PAS domain-containing protein [Pseudorhodoplanes sp.]|uniref:PAS domain-containing protein n=1 Tax=Pseudorhodoplanes sp. TaxID=1934341 RepID=UPI002BE1D2AF|nr:PAS domain-containing protein [Pseudorhodoplanes sp.]HWV43671.1 PAS domain-containing protein [Pseudorhodoplanes sp.]
MVLTVNGSGIQETFRFLEAKTNSGVWSLDFATRKMMWSDGFYALLGLEPGSVEPSYETIVELMHPDDRRPAGEFDRIVNEGLPLDRELRIIQPNGKLRWLANRSEVQLDKSGKPLRAFGVLLDVTPQRETALAKEAAEARFRALVIATNAFVWTAHADGQILDIRNWRELRGENPAELLGSKWVDLVHPDDRERTQQTWSEALASKHEYVVEHRIRQPDGDYRWVQSRAAPILQETGAVREWVGITSDIHDRKVWPATSEEAEGVLTGAQLRAARGVLNWSVRELSQASGVSSSTIRRLEDIDGPPPGREEALRPLQSALEGAGVEFLFPPSGKPGVRPR